MSDKKRLRLIVHAMVEVESELSPHQAMEEFQNNCMYTFEDTENVQVIQTEWRETEIVSVLSNI